MRKRSRSRRQRSGDRSRGILAAVESSDAIRLLISLRSDYVAQALETFSNNDSYPALLFLGPLSREAVERLLSEFAGSTQQNYLGALLEQMGPQPSTALLQMALSSAEIHPRNPSVGKKTLQGAIQEWIQRVLQKTAVDKSAVSDVMSRLVTAEGFRATLPTTHLPTSQKRALEDLAQAGIVTIGTNHSGLSVAELTHELLLPVIARMFVATAPKASQHEQSTAQSRAEVFVSYAHEDQSTALLIYDSLKTRGFRPWIDKYDISAGREWSLEIAHALERADFIVICLSSKAYHKRGYIQREIRMALERCMEIPPGEALVFPVRLDECPVPREIAKYQYTDFFSPDGLRYLLDSMQREWRDQCLARGGA